MFFWYLALSAAIVWAFFGDPSIDFRMVFVGALLPDVVAYITGSPYSHSVLSVIALLAVVMLATINRRSLRRSIIFIVIGAFLHLVLDGSWTNKELFWYPLFGSESIHVPPTQAIFTVFVKEAIGIALLVKMASNVGIKSRADLRQFFRTGRVSFQRKSNFFA